MRSVPPWEGKSDDEPVPPRVRLRTFDRKNGRCHRCSRKIMAGEKWTCEHIVALCNGGKNIEANLGLSCSNCLPDKNAEDVAEKADVYRVRAKHLGIHQPKRVFPGSRRDKLKKHVDGRTSQR